MKALIESEALKAKPSKRHLAENTKSEKTLEELSNDYDGGVRCYVAFNPNCPEELLQKLSKDWNYHVRYSVVYNPNCPIEILEKLSNNPDDVTVQYYAKERLNRIRSAQS